MPAWQSAIMLISIVRLNFNFEAFPQGDCGATRRRDSEEHLIVCNITDADSELAVAVMMYTRSD